MTTDMTKIELGAVVGPDWVDELLLRGPDDDICLDVDGPVTRAALRAMVAQRQERLAAAGLGAGGSLALRLPPSLAYVANLLAGWRLGAQVVLLDHRLTQFEVDAALDRLAVQVVVSAGRVRSGALRAFADVEDVVTARAGRPAATPHAVIQLSSGSTGPSKVIGRTAADLIAELDRYTRMDGVPLPGERIIVLASMVHVLGLVGALLYGLHAGVRVQPPQRLTGDSVLEAVAADPSPATVLGVPFHIGLLASVVDPPQLPQLKRMTTGGELQPPAVVTAFTEKYGVPLGNMWGMTEVGVIATDLFGEHRPSLRPAFGLAVVERGGELLVSRPESPYVGLSDPDRWADGWLHTRDAGTVDPHTGLVTIKGRLDSQISIGGLKVDLTEVEETLGGLPGVEAAVVVHDSMVTAYVQLAEPATVAQVEAGLAERLAAYKRPRRVHALAAMPRTTTGKLVRDRSVLRDASREER
ncbi:class I adenylate-forming enzyme family protein [Labedaea rhizosphaerae]|uniref:Acyl-CoA synthetase (AMP-forming)/AMP-acid ligase II n=1 Tax=Labedaea rhizosphaerae TaxID=598644 RepID=A0A4R6S2W7_LABRH|nr:fatty acid--CoA ligase family protein [Labedaea rhizosphaerae]TDP93006.1 acyl-CoA synthetase (AMP-forming)/AMP-acid ligase II [Labedaea rhizosphaerae]